MSRDLLKFLFPLLCLSMPLHAQQVHTVHNGVRLNWSQLRLEFGGTGQGNSLAQLEEQAWQQGFQHLQHTMPSIYAQHYPAAGKTVIQQAAPQVFRHLQVRETVYYSDHRVQLVLNAALAQVFTSGSLKDSDAPLPQARNSGLVLRAARYFPPRAVYEIRGKNGQSYFDISMVRKKYFQRRMMGRYFRNVATTGLTRYVGRQPQELAVREISPAVLEVDDRAWQRFVEGNMALLAQARIVIVLPATKSN